MENSTKNSFSQSSIWALLIYTILSFYIFGILLASYCITFPHFESVHDNWLTFMSVYNTKMMLFLKIPSLLWILSAVSMYFFGSKSFPKWMIYISVGLTLITVLITILHVLPLFNTMQSDGFKPETQADLLSTSVFFQIIPAGIVCLLVLIFLNIYFQSAKPLVRWIFIIITVLTFYLIGANTIEALTEYRLWNIVSPADWLAYRHSNHFGLFIAVYLLPGWLPFLLIIAMIWLRPKGVSVLFPIFFLMLEIWAAYITATYFIPKAQSPLDLAYSKQILIDLVENDNLKRVWVMYILGIIASLMFLKTGENKTLNN